MYCRRNGGDYIRGHRVRGERRVRGAVVGAKWLKCDSSVSDYVFSYCRDIIDLMRRGLWAG